MLCALSCHGLAVAESYQRTLFQEISALLISGEPFCVLWGYIYIIWVVVQIELERVVRFFIERVNLPVRDGDSETSSRVHSSAL